MTWLVTHMYAVLAATGFASLLLGWAIRGTFARARIDKVIGERRILQADLDGSKEEIERLYTAQRRASLDGATSVSDPAVRTELDARDKRINDLTSDVNRLKSELDAARQSSGRGETAAPIAAATATEEPTLVWRNRHLESRVRHLESTLASGAAAIAAPVIDGAAEPAAQTPTQSASDPVDAEKQRWRMGYIETRAIALEDELANLRAVAAPAAAVAETPAAAAPPVADASSNDQEELARLRWRNRFLEGRIAYFEGEKSGDVTASAPNAEATSAAAVAVASAAAAVSAEPVTAEKDAPLASALLSHLERADAELDAAEKAPGPPAALVLEKVKPQALKGAVNGKPDDLTTIGGIGPKIQDVLFKLGIFHFDQIAAWTPENIAWVNQHLDFAGRIEREGWVEQAVVLAGEA